MSKRLSHKRELLHALLGQHKTSHRKSGGVPFGLSHERELLPGEQRLRQTSRRQIGELSEWLSHERRLLFAELIVGPTSRHSAPLRSIFVSKPKNKIVFIKINDIRV